MKSLKRISSVSILFILILAFSAANSVHAVGVVDKITVGDVPVGIACLSGRGEIFVANSFTNSLSVISDNNNTVTQSGYVQRGSGVLADPQNLVYDAAKDELFVTGSSSIVSSIPPLNPDAVWVIARDNPVTTATSSAIAPVVVIPIGGSVVDLAYDSAKGEIWVTNFDGPISVISDTNNTVIATITVKGYSGSIAYDSAKGEMFVSDYGDNMVSVISDNTNTVVATIPVEGAAGALAYDGEKGEVFVSNYTDVVSVISDTNNKVIATVPVEGYLSSLAYDSAKGEIFIENSASAPNSTAQKVGYVSVISDSSNAVIGKITVGANLVEMAYDSANNEVYVTNFDNTNISSPGTVYVISDSSDLSASASPTVPEFSNTLILVLTAVLIETFCVIAWAVKKSTRTIPNSEQ